MRGGLNLTLVEMVKEKQILSKGKDIIRRFVGYVLFVFIPCFSSKR